MYAERTEGRRRVEEPCQNLYVCRIICWKHRMGRAPPIYKGSGTRTKPTRFTYLVLGGDGSVPLQARTDPSATCTPISRVARPSLLTTGPPPFRRRTRGYRHRR